MNTNQTSKVRSKLLPIYIVKKNSENTETLDRKKVNFQINFGNTYQINYKYFTPKGYHLASGCVPNVTCRYTDEGLNVPSITFTYVKNETHHAKPIWVNYIDVDNNKRIRKGSARGPLDQIMDVTHKVMIPNGYHLCPDQKTIFKVGKYIQSIDLMVKKNAVKPQAKVINKPTPKPSYAESSHHEVHHHVANHVNVEPAHVEHHNHHDQVASHPSHDSHNSVSSVDNSLKTLENNIQKYDCSLAVKLIHELLRHNLDFFKKVITGIFTNMKYKGINNFKLAPHEHKISGVIKKYLYNNNQVNFTFVRAKLNDIHDEITVSQVRDFVTSVMDHNCSKGIFITTSHFSPEAKKEAERHSIILINDMHLAKLMINNDVGVKPRRIIKVVDVDNKFFD